jgi:hypothetical protein
MARGYRLESLHDEWLSTSTGSSVQCQHIRAVLMAADASNLPSTIELWARRDTGMAVRLSARWELAGADSGLEAIQLTFQGDAPSLPDDWFTAEGHVDGRNP